jgi:hypothetical protein
VTLCSLPTGAVALERGQVVGPLREIKAEDTLCSPHLSLAFMAAETLHHTVGDRSVNTADGHYEIILNCRSTVTFQQFICSSSSWIFRDCDSGCFVGVLWGRALRSRVGTILSCWRRSQRVAHSGPHDHDYAPLADLALL